jgi:hypothetical protein
MLLLMRREYPVCSKWHLCFLSKGLTRLRVFSKKSINFCLKFGKCYICTRFVFAKIMNWNFGIFLVYQDLGCGFC